MNNINQINKTSCTGCGACSIKCPKNCIRLEKDDTDNIYPVIDEGKCIDCGLCMLVCNATIKELTQNEIKEAYASWSTDAEIRKNAASGGVITSIYKYAEQNNFYYVGVKFDKFWNLKYEIAKKENDWKKYANSKYVLGDLKSIFVDIENILKKKQNKILVVGLPCQISALKKFLIQDYDNLFTIDLICHGVCSGEYLKQHIKNIEKTKDKVTSKLYFRNPKFGTDTFHFTLEDKVNIFYDKKINENDCYQIGYHRAITYRENCYQCKYANINRVSDITVGDYWGIGKKIPFEYETKKISLVLANTKKGKKLLNDIKSKQFIMLIKRPIEEPIKVQNQLNRPSIITKQHYKFMKEYRKYKNFDKAARNVMIVDIICNKYKLTKIQEFIKRIKRVWTKNKLRS